MRFLKPLLLVSLFLSISILVFYSCKKNEHSYEKMTPEQKFFSISPSTPESIQNVYKAVKKQNEERNFVDKVISNFGFPLWDKSLIAESSPAAGTRVTGGGGGQALANLVYVPFAKEGNDRITGILVVKLIPHDSLFFMLGANHYESYGFRFRDSAKWNARDVFNVFMLFEKRVFGHNKFRILDRRLFPLTGAQVPNQNPNGVLYVTKHPAAADSTNGKFSISLTTCEYVDVCYDSDGGSNCCGVEGLCMQGCGCWDHEEFECTWTDISIGSDGGPLSNGIYGGGGWENTSPCKTMPDANDPNGVQCIATLPTGWTPIFTEVEEYDPYQADTIKITNNLRDSFPCLYRLLHDSLGNINLMSQLHLFGNFNVMKNNHYLFAIDWNLDSTSQPIAYTKKQGTSFNYTWIDTIYFNPYWVRRASKELLIAVTLHESVHAFIWWCFKEYQRPNPDGSGLIDSNYLKDHFLTHWEYFNGTPGSMQNNAHTLMAYNYVDFISTKLYPFTNRAAPEELRRFVANSLARGGLRQTSGWGLIGGMTVYDTCKINKVNYWAQRFQNSDTSAGTIGFCNTSTSAYRDSLQLKNPCQ